MRGFAGFEALLELAASLRDDISLRRQRVVVFCAQWRCAQARKALGAKEWPTQSDFPWQRTVVCCTQVFFGSDVIVGPPGQDFEAVLGDGQCMFPLRRGAPIFGDDSPTVTEQFDVTLTRVDHRFNGEGHAFL